LHVNLVQREPVLGDVSQETIVKQIHHNQRAVIQRGDAEKATDIKLAAGFGAAPSFPHLATLIKMPHHQKTGDEHKHFHGQTAIVKSQKRLRPADRSRSMADQYRKSALTAQKIQRGKRMLSWFSGVGKTPGGLFCFSHLLVFTRRLRPLRRGPREIFHDLQNN
jgi:hypothetical protein